MERFKEHFMSSFNRNDKDQCVELTIDALNHDVLSIPILYEEILGPALYTIDDCVSEDHDCIWQEHVKTAIIRTVIESVYPYVIKMRKSISPLGISVVLACPEKEYHDIGLRMMSDFFVLNGYHSVYIGSNTPRNQICTAISKTHAKYLAISVTDYYLLFEAQKMIHQVKHHYKDQLKIIAGGHAFKNNTGSLEDIGVDVYLHHFQDIVNLRRGETK